MTKSLSFRLSTFAFLLWVACVAAAAQSYPTRPIRLVAGTSPGGITDFLARTAATGLSSSLGQTVVVDNRAGATGTVAVDLVAKSAADGYTLLMVAGGNIVITPFLYPSLPVDPVNSLTPVFNMAGAPQLLVVTGTLPVKDLREFIALAKSRPGSVNYASAGLGSTTHLAADHFARLAGAQLVHIPYKGVGPALADLIAGRVQMLSVGLGPVQAHLKSGTLKALTVASKKRLDALPDLPTSAEAGLPGYEMPLWFGLAVPKGTPRPVVDRINGEVRKVLVQIDFETRLQQDGLAAGGGTPEQLLDMIRREMEQWRKVIDAAGIKAN